VFGSGGIVGMSVSEMAAFTASATGARSIVGGIVAAVTSPEKQASMQLHHSVIRVE